MDLDRYLIFSVQFWRLLCVTSLPWCFISCTTRTCTGSLLQSQKKQSESQMILPTRSLWLSPRQRGSRIGVLLITALKSWSFISALIPVIYINLWKMYLSSMILTSFEVIYSRKTLPSEPIKIVSFFLMFTLGLNCISVMGCSVFYYLECYLSNSYSSHVYWSWLYRFVLIHFQYFPFLL